MVAPRVIDRESALPERVKNTTLAQEIIRVKRNTCKPLRKRMEKEQMSRFAMKMMLSGYNKRERKEILVAGLKGFKKLEELEEQGKRNINRSRGENYEARLLAKYGAKSSWYKGKKGGRETVEKGGKRGRGKESRKKQVVDAERQIEAVLFIPATPDGELARLIQEGDDKIREGTGERRLKVVERGGEPSERNCAGITRGGM